MDKAIKWFHDNKLTVNIEKSCAIAIGTQQRLKNQTEQLSISIGNANLSLVETIKYLGVTIDDNISWNQHVNNLCSKISPRIELLRKLKYKLPTEQLITVYQSIIHFDYCISVWGYTSKRNVKLLQRLQNRAARIITGKYDWNLSASQILMDLGWMNINQRIDYFTTLLTFKALNGFTPNYISETLHTQESSYNFRNTHENDLIVPRVNLEVLKKSFTYNAPKKWNILSLNVRQSNTVDTFKTRYKVLI